MQTVNMLQAKSNLSRLVEVIEQGEEHEIIIVRNGQARRRLVPLSNSPLGPRLGVAKDAFNEQVARLFLGELSL